MGAVVARLQSASHHPVFYFILAGIALQSPSSTYTINVYADVLIRQAHQVIQIADGFGLLSLGVLELMRRRP